MTVQMNKTTEIESNSNKQVKKKKSNGGFLSVTRIHTLIFSSPRFLLYVQTTERKRDNNNNNREREKDSNDPLEER